MLRAVTLAGVVLAAAGAMQLRSNDIPAGGVFPRAQMATDCGGENRSPVLSWGSPPPGVRSFALIMHDADAPVAGGFYHWVVYDISAQVRGLASGAQPAAAKLGETSLGKREYYGPCPPPGPPHHYTLTLYALDFDRITGDAPLTGAQLEVRIKGHVLARAVLAATASNR